MIGVGRKGYDVGMTSSPFPGMDPYLEPHWLDVHTKLVAYAADDLNGLLPEDLIASTEERVAVESEDDDDYDGEEGRVIAPDVRVFESHSVDDIEPAPSSGVIAAPFRLLARVEPITERFIRIIEVGTERLVTIIEFVSPTNKRGGGLKAFRRKRAELLDSGANFVEIDLVRAGNWRALMRPHVCGRRATSAYRATVRVPADREAAYLFPLNLRERLPMLAIPLRAADEEVRLDLQSLIDRAYRNGRYARRLDYAKPPTPALDPGDGAWAEDLLKSAGRR